MKSHVVFAEEWASSFDDGACACHLDINTYSSYRTHTRSKRGEVNTRLSFQIDGNGAAASAHLHILIHAAQSVQDRLNLLKDRI